MTQFRVGEGWDRHRLVDGESLVLAGVELESPRGTEGFSDGDVMLHALVDALLGAAGLGDIGSYFPSGDDRWKNADSAEFLRRTLTRVRDEGWTLNNIDATLVLERPRLAPHRAELLNSLADITGSDTPTNLKFKSADGLGVVGRAEAVEARAIVLLRNS